MSALREAAQQAAEALYRAREFTELYDTEHAASVNEQCHDTITALRAALAQQAEPVEPVATLIAQRNALLEALKNILPFVATQAIGCHGYKCREQWCWSCYGEEDAEEAASQALGLAKEASRIIKEVEGTK